MSSFAHAPAYEALMGRWSRQLAEPFITFAGIADGARVLDVGCGTGSLSAGVLDRFAAARVTGIDPSPAFVDATRARLGGKRAAFEVGDAQALQFDVAAFDAALSMLVLNFVPAPERAAAEMRRVTRPGGHVGACVWDYDGGMVALTAFWNAVVALDPNAESHIEQHMPLRHEGEVGALFRAAGLVDVRDTPLTIEQRFTSFDDFWQPFLGGVGPSGAYVTSLSDAARAALAARLRSTLWNDDPATPRTLPARAWAAVGVVPAR